MDAIYNLAQGVMHRDVWNATQDSSKANALYLTGGEPGCADAYFNLGNAYTWKGRCRSLDVTTRQLWGPWSSEILT